MLANFLFEWGNDPHIYVLLAAITCCVENLSPVQAPERTAPAIIAGLIPMVAPILINAIPSVADTV